MTETKTIPWNTEDHLETPEDIAAYLEAVIADGVPELISHALGAAARYKALSPEGRPEFVTVLRVVRALGLKLTVTAA